MNILVTGGAGFIGSHLSERLLKEGHRVICFDNYNESTNHLWKWRNIRGFMEHPNYRLIDGDVRDKSYLDIPFNTEKIDIAMHLAAQTGVRPSVQNPILHYKTNVLGTVNILQYCVKYEVKQLIFTSSSSVYGCNSKSLFSEEDKVDNLLSPYAATKKAGENICFVFNKLYDLNVTILRPFTVYGPRQRKEMAISLFTRLISNEKKITIFGDGSNSRDYTFIEDMIDGFILAMGRSGYEIFNIGGGYPVSLSKLIFLIEEILGKKAEIDHEPMQLGEATHTCASTEKAKDLLGYFSKVKIEDGINRYIEWYKEDKKNYE